MKGIHRRILAALIVVAAIVTLGLIAQRYASMDWLIAQENQLRLNVAANPLQAWLIGLVVYVGLSLIPGTSGKAVIFGWLFGFWAAVIMVDMALTAAAMATFYLSRFLFRDAVEARFSIHLDDFRKKLESNAGFYLLMIRLLHAPFSFVNYGSGATNLVPVSTFFWTTAVGLLPGTMIFVFAGTRIPTLSVIAEQGAVALLDQKLIAALVATGILPLVIRGATWFIRRWMNGRHTDCVKGNSV